LNQFHTTISRLTYHPPTLPLISDHTGTHATPQQLTSPTYWTNHLRHPVRFHEAIHTATQTATTTFLELGPDPTLTTFATETSPTTEAIPLLRRDRPEVVTALTAAARLHLHGTPVNWPATLPTGRHKTVDLPTYAFQRRRHWLDRGKAADASAGAGGIDEAHARFWDTVSRGDLDSLVATLGADGEQVRGPLGTVLPALASWHTASDTRSTIDSWRYRTAWRPVGEQARIRVTGRWLLVRPAHAEAAAWTDALARALAARGVEVTPVVIDVGDAGDTGDTGRAGHDALVAALTSALHDRLDDRFDGAPGTGSDRQPGDRAVGGVLSLLSFDDALSSGHPAVPRGGAAEVALIQALDATGISGRLWIATGGAVSTGPSDPVGHPLRALGWGLGPVVAAEKPERWGGLLDLPPLPDARTAESAATALLGDHGESELAVRATGLLARRLVPAPLPGGAVPASWRPDGTVLITGGTGALGGHVARRLAARGARRLLLIGRRGLDAPGAAELVTELADLGAQATVVSCDVSDRDALAAVLASVPPEHPLTSVVHTAAVLDDSLIDSLTVERMHRVQRVKVGGALNLHELTRDLGLSAFVLFSSITGTLGTAGQGNYAPGNAFLDALAEHRRAAGLPATSIAWGHWDGEGIAGPDARRQLLRGGFPPMAPGLAVTALEEALTHGETRLVVSRADWATVLGSRPSPLLGELPEARENAAGAPAPGSVHDSEHSEGEEDLARRLASLPEADQRQTVRRLVRAEVAAVLGYGSAADVDDHRGFRDQGFSSLSAVELRNRLARLTGTALPSSLVFDHPTPAALVEHLRAVLVPEPEPPLTAVLAKIDELESLLAGAPVSPSDREVAAARLRRLVETPSGTATGGGSGASSSEADLSSVSDDELISFISNELGIS
ncbi:SDR family NAD(P)-dependent oxidoreductase, partial [Streptosporangium sp. NPDC051022]|uniref:SDR family NAD(P)-dependent oxidoreductase n=1 Tax=Streptosporangium sp. NPDC051022 TaxID=3155752 RepID=UPI00341B5FED